MKMSFSVVASLLREFPLSTLGEAGSLNKESVFSQTVAFCIFRG